MTPEEILKKKFPNADQLWAIPYLEAMKEFARAECKNVILWLMHNERVLADTSDCDEIIDEYYRTHKDISI